MFRVAHRGEGLSETQRTSCRASIEANVRLDDGVETNREFEIEAELLGLPFQFTIPAAEFARMDWPIAEMGIGAITFPNQKEYARTAIQSYSMTAEERCVYTHTGWRKVDRRRLFLHGAGALGAIHSRESPTTPASNPTSKPTFFTNLCATSQAPQCHP
jgi:hypothetical protein